MQGFMLCLNIPEYTGICVNMPKSVLMAVALPSHCGYITVHMVTYLNVYGQE